MKQQFKVTWEDAGRDALYPPNPDYPQGIDVDLTGNAERSCFVKLPYPARRCGVYVVECSACHCHVAVTTAGRPDDPRSVRVPCKEILQ